MLHQSRVGGSSNSSQQDEVKIIVVREDLEIITRLDFTACPYGFRQYKLATLAYNRRHKV